MNLLHVVLYPYTQAASRYIGMTRDTMGRVEYFEERGIHYEQVHALFRKDDELLRIVKEMDLTAYDVFFFEKSHFPRTMRFLRKTYPDKRLILRSHNAEFFHRVHYLFSRTADRPHDAFPEEFESIVGDLLGSFASLGADYACAAAADAVVSISDWETRHYWPLFTDPAKVLYAPFFLPKEDAPAPGPAPDKEPLCLCLLSSAYTPLLRHALIQFNELVAGLEQEGDDWRFVVTGSDRRYLDLCHPRIETPGWVEHPFELLDRAACVVLPSDFGFGFKTKVLEAVSRGCWVIAPPGLREYLPPELRPFVIALERTTPECFRQALDQARKRPGSNDVNTAFRQRHFAALDQAFALAQAPRREADPAAFAVTPDFLRKHLDTLILSANLCIDVDSAGPEEIWRDPCKIMLRQYNDLSSRHMEMLRYHLTLKRQLAGKQ